MQLPRAVHPDGQHPLDIGGAARPGDVGDVVARATLVQIAPGGYLEFDDDGTLRGDHEELFVKSTIPLEQLTRYPVLVALKMDGRYMRVRDKGPLWIVFPWDDYPELADEKTKQRSIWQLKAIHIR